MVALDGRLDQVQQRLRVDAQHDDQGDQRRHDRELAAGEVEHRAASGAGAVRTAVAPPPARRGADSRREVLGEQQRRRGGPCIVRWYISRM